MGFLHITHPVEQVPKLDMNINVTRIKTQIFAIGSFGLVVTPKLLLAMTKLHQKTRPGGTVRHSARIELSRAFPIAPITGSVRLRNSARRRVCYVGSNHFKPTFRRAQRKG